MGVGLCECNYDVRGSDMVFAVGCIGSWYLSCVSGVRCLVFDMWCVVCGVWCVRSDERWVVNVV